MKGGKYTKTLAKIWVEGIIRIRYRRKCFTQIWRALYGDAMLELIRMSSYMADGNPQEHLLPSFIGVRAGGGEGGLQPPQILGNSDFLGSERKFGQSQFLKTSPFYYLIILKSWILTWSRRNNPVTLQWLLSMWRVTYIFAVFFWLGTILHCTSWNGLFPVENWLK